ncbi:MAG: protein-L-isoaspartate(D-aspartate) O-methyltransferase [Armatimonadetes bacterium]|nr:protein-L-isoaspartate(D-aspartate) O-methyltransferase [Armatimonadota bacterium]
MVEFQLRARGIKDQRVLRVMEEIPRELFVPKVYRSRAYEDSALPIGEGQTISQPYVVALMTQCLRLQGTERILEIGTGSGYQAAILGKLAKEVFTIEILEPLAREASALLLKLGYTNIHTKVGDGYKGWEEHAPFDAIIVTAAPLEIPQKLVEQLKDGGRMVLPLGDGWAQDLILLTKQGKETKKEVITNVRFVPMIKGVK